MGDYLAFIIIMLIFTAVVWNPWEEKARGMSDFGDDEVSRR